MSGREQVAETEKTVVPGITKKAKYRIFILAVLIAGVLTGVVTTRMHALPVSSFLAVSQIS